MSFGKELSASTSEGQSGESVCRVCMSWASDSGLMVGLFVGQVQGMILAEVLALVGAVEMATEDDCMPKGCCEECLNALESAFKLRMLCQDSDRRLRDVFSSDGQAVVVKEEVDEDKLNSLDEKESEHNLELDGILNAGEAVVSASLHAPKLEILDYLSGEESQEIEDDVYGTGDMVEDDMDAVSSIDESGDAQDVFDEVKAVGFKCCGCKIMFNTSKELEAHSMKVHADKQLANQESKGSRYRKQCDICYKILCNAVALRRHKQKDKMNYRCKVCGELFWSRKRVRLHYERIHGPNSVIKGPSNICCACLKQFETKEQLREHSDAVHLPENPAPDPDRPFPCNVCYRRFKSDARLYAHQSRKLKSSKNYVCLQCGKAFRHPGVLRYHELSHTGEKVFQCSKCPKAYSNRDTYKKHVASHKRSADKYKCEVCGKCFTTPRALRQHKAQHTGERPHKCPHCSSSFITHGRLKAHSVKHSAQKSDL